MTLPQTALLMGIWPSGCSLEMWASWNFRAVFQGKNLSSLKKKFVVLLNVVLISVVQEWDGNYTCSLRTVLEWLYNFGTKMVLIIFIYWSRVFLFFFLVISLFSFFFLWGKAVIFLQYLQNILRNLTPNFVCNSVPWILDIIIEWLDTKMGKIILLKLRN